MQIGGIDPECLAGEKRDQVPRDAMVLLRLHVVEIGLGEGSQSLAAAGTSPPGGVVVEVLVGEPGDAPLVVFARLVSPLGAEPPGQEVADPQEHRGRALRTAIKDHWAVRVSALEG